MNGKAQRQASSEPFPLSTNHADGSQRANGAYPHGINVSSRDQLNLFAFWSWVQDAFRQRRVPTSDRQLRPAGRNAGRNRIVEARRHRKSTTQAVRIAAAAVARHDISAGTRNNDTPGGHGTRSETAAVPAQHKPAPAISHIPRANRGVALSSIRRQLNKAMSSATQKICPV